jgi:adenylate cyclase
MLCGRHSARHGKPQCRRATSQTPDFRIGISAGDIFEDRDILGDAVHVAVELEALAEPGGIRISRSVRNQVRNKLDFACENPGEQQLRNTARQLRVYRVNFDKPAKVHPACVLRADFESAVKAALRQYTRTDLLVQNQLLQARVVSRGAPGGGTPRALQALLSETAGSLFANERDRKLYRVLELTYFKPAPKQEAAAHRLGLPFSTYRRHLTTSVDRLTEWLWRLEQEAPRDEAIACPSAERAFGDASANRDGNLAELRDVFQPAASGLAPPSELYPTPSWTDKASIAVMPFQNIGGDPEQEYFADGVVEEITAALSRVRTFFVMARNSTFTYKGRAVDVKQVSRELGVRYVLDGSVRKAREHVRITAQLIDATTGNHIWSDRYDGSIEDIFDLQDRITESVAGAIQPSILLAEIERTKRKRPESLAAYDYILRALPHVWAFDPTLNTMALNHLNRALEIEPNYPLALSLAAWCQARQITYQWTSASDEARAEGLRLAKLAGEMDNDDPMVLTMLCAAHSVIGDLDVASALMEKALALDPNSAVAWQRSGWVNVYLIRPEIAIAHFQRAIRLSPFDPMNFNCLYGIGAADWAAERYEDALLWFKKAILERPAMESILRPMAACLGQLGRISEASEAVQRLRGGYPGLTISKVMAITPFCNADFRRRYADGLRRAGLPE